MNRLILLFIACILFLKGLGAASMDTYSKSAIAIITHSECNQRSDGNYVCNLKVSYSPTPSTLLHQVPLKTVGRQQYFFGGTPTIYFNPRDPQTISIQRYVPTSLFNTFFIILAMSTLFLAGKNIS